MTTYSNRPIRNRRLLFFLPLPLIAFSVFMFWIFGGGRQADEHADTVQHGLNTALPSAQLKNDPLDKLAYYERSASDSAKLRERVKHDPYLRDSGDPAAKVYKQLSTLDELVKKSEQEQLHRLRVPGGVDSRSVADEPVHEPDEIKRLERLANTNVTRGRDPEIAQLDSLLDKLIDVQQPATPDHTEAHRSFVYVSPVTDHIAFGARAAFNDIVNDRSPDSAAVIRATISANQVIVPGAELRLQLVTPISIQHTIVPEGTALYGHTRLDGDRLKITINTILFQQVLHDVALVVYDVDGVEGLYVPGATGRDVARQSLSRSSQGVAFNGLNGSAAGQLATAGIEAGKNFLSRRPRQVKLTLKQGHQLLLVNKK